MEKSHLDIDQVHPRILVVDDDVDMCCMMANYLKKIGYTVSMACSAADAYGMIEKEPYETIISDIKMPGEDGISLLVRVRKAYPDTPVILMADSNDAPLAIAAIKHGAFDSVQKPLDFIHLEKLVERAIHYSRLQRQEKNYPAELEQTVTERTLELQSVAEQLRVELAGQKNAEEQLEQAWKAAEAVNEQLRSELAERLQLESSLQQTATEQTLELQAVVDQLRAELAERKSTEEQLEQARMAAEAANEELQTELTAERKAAEEQLEQACLASEATKEQLRSEERRVGKEC